VSFWSTPAPLALAKRSQTSVVLSSPGNARGAWAGVLGEMINAVAVLGSKNQWKK